MRVCAFPQCKNSTYRIERWKQTVCKVHNVKHETECCNCPRPFTLIPFPMVDEVREMWAKAVNRKQVKKGVETDWAPTVDSRVCSMHFVDGRPTPNNPYPIAELDKDTINALKLKPVCVSPKKSFPGEIKRKPEEPYPRFPGSIKRCRPEPVKVPIPLSIIKRPELPPQKYVSLIRKPELSQQTIPGSPIQKTKISQQGIQFVFKSELQKQASPISIKLTPDQALKMSPVTKPGPAKQYVIAAASQKPGLALSKSAHDAMVKLGHLQQTFPVVANQKPGLAKQNFPVAILPKPELAKQNFLAATSQKPGLIKQNFPAAILQKPELAKKKFPAATLQKPGLVKQNFPPATLQKPGLVKQNFPLATLQKPGLAKKFFSAVALQKSELVKQNFSAATLQKPGQTKQNVPLQLLPVREPKSANPVNKLRSDHNSYCKPKLQCDKCIHKQKIIQNLRRRNKLLILKLMNSKRYKPCSKTKNTKLFLKSNKSVQYYIGLPNKQTFQGLLDHLAPLARNFTYWKGSSKCVTKAKRYTRSPRKQGRYRRLCVRDELLLVLLTIRLGHTNKMLANLFGISACVCRQVIILWIKLMAKKLKPFIFWINRRALANSIPSKLVGMYPQLCCTVDCMEISIERPKHIGLNAETWSANKKCNTIKALIAIAPNGFITFVSKAYGGRVSDQLVTHQSGFLDHIEPSDTILADTCFSSEESHLGRYLQFPTCKLRQQMQYDRQRRADTIDYARKYVKCAIERIKCCKILTKTLPMRLVPVIDDLIIVCAALSNLSPPLVV